MATNNRTTTPIDNAVDNVELVSGLTADGRSWHYLVITFVNDYKYKTTFLSAEQARLIQYAIDTPVSE